MKNENCYWFDGGCCLNEKAFPDGVPTEIGGATCENCEYYTKTPNQEFQIGNLKLIQDSDGYAIMRMVTEGVFEAIATFKYPEDAITYFANTIMQALAYQQTKAH
jgi:hypothetical protein